MRAFIAVLGLTLVIGGEAGAQGFRVDSGPVFALLGCDVVGAPEPEVEFAQIPSGVIGLRFIGDDDFVGEDCADVLSLLLRSGFRILASRPVRQGAAREILVYDLIARERSLRN